MHYCPWCMTAGEANVCPRCGRNTADYTAANHHLRPGSILDDRYVVGGVLGQGGFGVTYIGLDTRIRKRVAIKEYFPTSVVMRETSVSNDLRCYTEAGRQFFYQGQQRFLQEAETLARLDDIKEIVQVSDFFSANGTAYFVMEYLEGRTFGQMLAQGETLSPDRTFALMEPIVRAMDRVHRAGVIHRDIKPDNLILLQDGTVKLMDFGCARDADGGQTMTVMVSRGFAPPEQYTGHDQGRFTDIYALCATMYACMTGSPPPQAIYREAEDSLRTPREQGLRLTDAQERALMKGLALRPWDRWQTMGELYAALYGRQLPGAAPDFVPGPGLPDPPPANIPSDTQPIGRDKVQSVPALPKKGGLWRFALPAAVLLLAIVFFAIRSRGPDNTVGDAASTAATPAPAAATVAPVTAAPAKTTATATPLIPTSTPEPAAEIVPVLYDWMPGNETDFMLLPFASAGASSVLRENDITFRADYAFDGDISRPWVEGAEGDGIGESLYLDFGKERELSLLKLRLGYADRDDRYEKNNRPREIRFVLSDGSSFTCAFPDRNADCYVLLGEPVRTSDLELVIESVYPGSMCQDTCITEVTAYMAA